MGVGPSTSPPIPDEAIDRETHTDHRAPEIHSSNVYGIRRGAGGVECVDGEAPAREEFTSAYEEYQERSRGGWPGYNPRLPGSYDTNGFPDTFGVLDASLPGRRAAIFRDDDDFGDEGPSRLGAEAAYFRAVADSHAGSCTPNDPDSAEAGSIPFKGQGSVMYSYRESSKMRFGTLNVKGSLQGASGVRLYVKLFTVCSVNGSVHVSLCVYLF